MKLLGLLIVSFVAILVSCTSSPVGSFSIEDRSYSSVEVKGLSDAGLLGNYFMRAVQKYRVEKHKNENDDRINEIIGFICASAVIRGINSDEYEKARQAMLDRATCVYVWLRYMDKSDSDTAKKLRGGDGQVALLNATQNFVFADTLCRSYGVLSKHVHDDPLSVQVISQLRRGTNKTIVEILKEENSRYLITTDEMRLLNIFITATGNEPFPFQTFEKYDTKYAIPGIRSNVDKQICAENFCKRGPKP